ncbi:NAD(P)-binding protein [Lophiostoma macrostomum CBS 122681]|uniref:NAD(P)-binding protein n=1 Tax=Lophiostoma macrostomum CBS 122681 TaxID=1314788 RepID=A0A6A6SKQ5_9PLEO|nr:NAD(P)-binding protein [Lophiostoma macrostomum CBS 122681]
MPGKTYLITGANRGLGHGLFTHYLAKPHNTIIAAVRNISAASHLLTLPHDPSTRIILAQIDSASKTDAFEAVAQLRAQGITSIDVVVSAAGIMPKLYSLEEQPLVEFEELLNVNAKSVLVLFQATAGLLRNARDEGKGNPKFVFISGKGGSLNEQHMFKGSHIAAHAAAKALANMLVLRMGVENDWLVAVCINPGLVQTDMGNAGARAAGLEKAFLTLEESSRNTAGIIDNATKEHSGKFFDEMIGRIHPW